MAAENNPSEELPPPEELTYERAQRKIDQHDILMALALNDGDLDNAERHRPKLAYYRGLAVESIDINRRVSEI